MSSDSNYLVFVASCMIDFVSYTNRLPNPGETLHSTKFATNFGGKGANQCVQAAKLGAKTYIIARVGDDEWGKKYIDYLNKLGVDTTYMKITPNCHTGIAQIVVSESGENQIVINAGANSKLTIKDLEEAKEVLKNAAVVVTQLETPTEVALKACELTEGVSILNGAPALTDYDDKLLRIPSIFCVNETEAGVFLHEEVKNLEHAKEACRKLTEKGAQTVLITLGELGALFYSPVTDKLIHKPAPKVKCVDTTGAGDSFLGAFAYLHSKKSWNVEEVIKAACFIAACSTEKPGTQISYADSSILTKIN